MLAPSQFLGLPAFGNLFPALCRMRELNLEERQRHLDQVVRGYMNREGRLSG